jgi:hypothetical protein
MPTVTYTNSVPGTTVTAFPATSSLADWSTAKVAMTEGSSPNTGRWTATLSVGEWVIFETGTQPASFASSVGTVTVEDEPLGTGARTVTITVTDGSAAIQGAVVRVTKSGQTYSGATNASGVIVFSLDDGTWTLAITATGFTYTPSTFVVDGTETISPVMISAGTITPSSAPLTTGYWVVYKETGVVDVGAVIELQAVSAPTGTGFVLEDRVRLGTSDSNGLVQFVNMFKGARYAVRRSDSLRKTNVTVPLDAGTSVALGNILG